MWKILVCLVGVLVGVVANEPSVDGVDSEVGEPLFLTPLLEEGRTQEAQQEAKVKPDIGNVTSYSGYFTVNKACESNLFFWFFPAQKNWKQAPVILWLQGGPGASSVHSVFEDIGILTYKDRLGTRNHSWNVENNLLFIDQPVGTGFSFTGKGCYAENETVIGAELYSAVVQFYQLFPELRVNKFIIAGCSYAGHYIPALGHTIHANNPTATIKINLVGMMIGDGWMDASYQSNWGSYLYQLGLVDDQEKNTFDAMHQTFLKHMNNQEYEKALGITALMRDDVYSLIVGDVSLFNYLKGFRDIMTESRKYESFIKSTKIRKAIHVANANYTFINYQVQKSLGIDIILSVKPWVEELLEHYFIVFYIGQLDVICAYPMTTDFLRSLKWSGADNYRNATRRKWCVGEQQVGYYKGTYRLYDVMVRSAGHSVPHDQPFWAYLLANSVASSTSGDALHALDSC